MQNMFRLVSQAVSDLENYLPDMVEAAETEKERKFLRDQLNRLALLINESRSGL